MPRTMPSYHRIARCCRGRPDANILAEGNRSRCSSARDIECPSVVRIQTSAPNLTPHVGERLLLEVAERVPASPGPLFCSMKSANWLCEFRCRGLRLNAGAGACR